MAIQFGSPEWFETNEGELWRDLTGNRSDIVNSWPLQALYHEGYYDRDILSPERIAARDTLKEFMWDEFGIDFEEEFDWYSWREEMGYP